MSMSVYMYVVFNHFNMTEVKQKDRAERLNSSSMTVQPNLIKTFKF